MKKQYSIITFLVCLLVLAAAALSLGVWEWRPALDSLTVGFVYEEDESIPATYNFHLAQEALEREYADKVRVLARSNVAPQEVEDPVRSLIRSGCRLLFTNTHSDQIMELAREYPEVQFCQVSYRDLPAQEIPDNYHTFNARVFEGRYVSGIAAGRKLRELIDAGKLKPEQALVGYVGAVPSAEVTSGFTAFLLGIRQEAPEAVMRVRYTGAWSNYAKERECTRQLIDEGCVIISNHTNTTGTAVACEAAPADRPVFHVGYNENMIDVAPTTALVSMRINWTPYVTGAVGALLAGREIEKMTDGDVHGQDMSAGFDLGWVEMLELNSHLAPEGTQEEMNRVIRELESGRLEVFSGDYTGADPKDPSDTCDLRQAYAENKEYSLPSFGYILDDVITVESP